MALRVGRPRAPGRAVLGVAALGPEGPTAIRIPDFFFFTGKKNKSQERRGSDINRSNRASPAWGFQYRVLLGCAKRNRSSSCLKKLYGVQLEVKKNFCKSLARCSRELMHNELVQR